MHTPYEEIRGHIHDFEVKYKFYTEAEGGRYSGPPYQGYRSDFWYEHSDAAPNRVFMIHPEFLDADGEVILYDDASVPNEGIARMWILSPILIEQHINNIKVGTKCYFMEGLKRTAECEVTKIVGLLTNPRTK